MNTDWELEIYVNEVLVSDLYCLDLPEPDVMDTGEEMILSWGDDGFETFGLTLKGEDRIELLAKASSGYQTKVAFTLPENPTEKDSRPRSLSRPGVIRDFDGHIYTESFPGAYKVKLACAKRGSTELVFKSVEISVSKEHVLNAPSSQELSDDSYNRHPRVNNLRIVGPLYTGYKLKVEANFVGDKHYSQWFRSIGEDGVPQLLMEETKDEYLLTADDVGSILSVECLSKTADGERSTPVRVSIDKPVALNPDVKEKVEYYAQKGEGTFDLILKDSKKDKRKVMEISLEKIKIKEGRFSKEKFEWSDAIRAHVLPEPTYFEFEANMKRYVFDAFDSARRDAIVLILRRYNADVSTMKEEASRPRVTDLSLSVSDPSYNSTPIKVVYKLVNADRCLIRWAKKEAGELYMDIPGAGEDTYIPTALDINSTIRVSLTPIGFDGSTGETVQEAVGIVIDAAMAAPVKVKSQSKEVEWPILIKMGDTRDAKENVLRTLHLNREKIKIRNCKKTELKTDLSSAALPVFDGQDFCLSAITFGEDRVIFYTKSSKERDEIYLLIKEFNRQKEEGGKKKKK